MLALTLLLLSSGCAGEADRPLLPSQEDVVRLEAKLANHRCVGMLEKWERNYRLGYQSKTFWPGAFEPEFDLIEFRYRQAGPVSIEPTRNVVPLGADHDWPDSAAVKTLTGRFNVRSGRLSVDRCRPVGPG